jgi:phage protein D
VSELPYPPPIPKRPKTKTPRQVERTEAITGPAAPDFSQPPPVPGPELTLPLQTLRQPRAGISLNGKRADHLLREMDVTNNRYFSADTWSCVLVLQERDPDFGRGYWQDVESLEVELFGGFGVDEPPSTSLLSGRADELQINLDERTVVLRGRDYTADLIELRLAEKWPNKTSSEIVQEVAARARLTADVTATSTLAGVYYKAEHAQLADETTGWNLVTFLAERERFDAYVKGRTIYFGPPPDPASAPSWKVVYEPGEPDAPMPRAPVAGLSLTKGLTVSRDIQVKVVSWNSGKKHSLEGRAQSKRPARSSSGQFQAAVTYVFRHAGLTQDQADARARQYAEEITKNLRSFDLETAALPGLRIESIVTIQGTGGSFDTDYHLDEIEWRISQGSGFTMRLRGRNFIPVDTAAL